MTKLNTKQIIVIVIGFCAVILSIYFAPRYKMTEISPGNYIKTEQSSSLYKRSTGKVKFYWGRMFLYESAILLFCGILTFLFKSKPKPAESEIPQKKQQEIKQENKPQDTQPYDPNQYYNP